MQVGDVKLLISELKKVKVLGHGSSGLVEKAVHESTGIVLSIKVILSKKKRESNRFTDCPLWKIYILIFVIEHSSADKSIFSEAIRLRIKDTDPL